MRCRAAVIRIPFTTLRRSFADGLAFCALVASVSGTLDFASAAKVRLSMSGLRRVLGCTLVGWDTWAVRLCARSVSSK